MGSGRLFESKIFGERLFEPRVRVKGGRLNGPWALTREISVLALNCWKLILWVDIKWGCHQFTKNWVYKISIPLFDCLIFSIFSNSKPESKITVRKYFVENFKLCVQFILLTNCLCDWISDCKLKNYLQWIDEILLTLV